MKSPPFIRLSIRQPRWTRLRQKRGAALALVAAAAFLIVLVIFAAFKIYVYLTGSQEVKNSVDASVLNVARHAWELEVNIPEQDTAHNYVSLIDVADSRHMIGLTNVNRMWGKLFLVAANTQQMKAQGYDLHGNAETVCQIAYNHGYLLNQELFQKLNNKQYVTSYFQTMAGSKPAKIMGDGGKVSPSINGNWATACGYPNDESNIQVMDPFEIPNMVVPEEISPPAATSPFLRGYFPMIADNMPFCFTTFHFNEASHLVSSNTFENWFRKPVANRYTPIPNSFRESGQLNQDPAFGSAACAVANPLVTYQLTIPHSFVCISLDAPVVTAVVEGASVATATYGPGTGVATVVETPYKTHAGNLVGYVDLGNEFNPPTLWQALNGMSYDGDHSAVISTLLQRIKEFKPTYTAGQLQALLSQTPIPSADRRINNFPGYQWIIYPTYSTPDLSDPTVQIGYMQKGTFPAGPALSALKQSANGFLPGNEQVISDWVQDPYRSSIEGIEKVLMQETTQINRPNTAWSTVTGWNYGSDYAYAETQGTLSWEPGTGYYHNLGNLRIHRTTTAYFTGQPPLAEPAPPK